MIGKRIGKFYRLRRESYPSLSEQVSTTMGEENRCKETVPHRGQISKPASRYSKALREGTYGVTIYMIEPFRGAVESKGGMICECRDNTNEA